MLLIIMTAPFHNSTNLKKTEVGMKIAVIIGIIAFMLADTFLMWCLLRASALYEQNENRSQISGLR